MNRTPRLGIIIFFCLVLCAPSYGQTKTKPACGFAPAGKLKIYYCEQGKGPVVLFLHAGFLDMHQWDRQAALLSKDHRVILIDMPGHGQSTGIDSTIKIAEVINRVMNKLKITTASIVGMSLGSACAIDFALAHPEKTTRLLLCSPGVSGWQDVLRLDTLSKQLFIRNDTYANTHDAQLISENFVHLWLDGPFRKTASVDSATRRYIFKTVYTKIHKAGGSAPVFDKKKKAAKRVQLLHKPVLILYGSQDIPFVIHVSQYLHTKIKGSEIHVIDGTAHLFTFEKPALFEQYLNSWIK